MNLDILEKHRKDVSCEALKCANPSAAKFQEGRKGKTRKSLRKVVQDRKLVPEK